MSAGVHWDLPFGVLDRESTGILWDTRLTPAQFTDFLRQFEAVQEASSWFASFNCHIEQVGELTHALREAHYVYITPVCWYKEGHTHVSNKMQLTPAFEIMVVARRQREGNPAHCYLEENPTHRHNFISGPSQRQYLMYDHTQKVNPTQKPEYVFKWVLERFCRPGQPVLICGTGAGGEVRAAADLQIDVVGVEQDRKQLTALHSSLIRYEADKDLQAKKEEQKLAAERAGKGKKAKKKKAVPAPSPEPSPVLAAAAIQPAEGDSPKQTAPESTKSSSSAPAAPSPTALQASPSEGSSAAPEIPESAAK